MEKGVLEHIEVPPYELSHLFEFLRVFDESGALPISGIMLHTFADNPAVILLPVFEDAEVFYELPLDHIGLE